MQRFLMVFVAGGLGSGTRYLVSAWAQQRFGTDFPWGTFIVNLVGCFLIGLVMQTALQVSAFPEPLRFALVSGFLGGLTTYSSFTWETTRLVRDGAAGAAALNLGLTTVGCFAAAAAGVAAVRLLVRA